MLQPISQSHALSVLAVSALSFSVNAQQATMDFACNSDLIFEGIEVNDHMGASMSAGQWTGSSDPEILTGSFDRWDPDIANPFPPNPKHGYAFMLSGSDHQWDGTVTPMPLTRFAQWPLFVLEGQTEQDRFGFAVAFVGDINRFPDPILPATTGAGVSGFHDSFGASPPLQDFVVGNPRGNPLGNGFWDRSGSVYVYFSTVYSPNGSTTPPLGAPTPDDGYEEASLIIHSTEDHARFGYSICPVGDWDDDGVDDFAVGAPGGASEDKVDAPNAQKVTGKVHIISGRLVAEKALAHFNTPTISKEVNLSAVLLHTYIGDSLGSDPMDRFGFSLSFLGNLGTGAAAKKTLAIGAPSVYADTSLQPHKVGHASVGYVELVSPTSAGAPEQRSRLTTPNASQPAIINSPAADNGVGFGFSLGASDRDGDGQNELLVGAPYWDHLDSAGTAWDALDSGTGFLLSPPIPDVSIGGIDPTKTITDAGVLHAQHDGLTNGEWMGYSVNSLGTWQIIGQPEAVYGISAWRGLSISNANGCRSVISGHPDTPFLEAIEGGGRISGLLHIYNHSLDREVKMLIGEDSRDSVGWSFLPVGDVSGDGYTDFVFSAPRWGLEEVVDPTSTTVPPETMNIAKEWGRVYYMDGGQ